MLELINGVTCQRHKRENAAPYTFVMWKIVIFVVIDNYPSLHFHTYLFKLQEINRLPLNLILLPAIKAQTKRMHNMLVQDSSILKVEVLFF